MLLSYRGVVKDGKVEIKDVALPDGTEVVVVTQSLSLSVAEQKKRLATLSGSAWQRPFGDYVQVLKENPAEADIAALSDTDLNELVHICTTSRSLPSQSRSG
jgi:hypothetical protein